MKFKFYTYSIGSKGAIEIQHALQEAGFNCLRIKPNGNYRRQLNNHLVINWGSCHTPSFLVNSNSNLFLNKISAVSIARDKLQTLECLVTNGIKVPEFTEDIEYAKLLALAGNTIYCRKSTTSYGGRFIEIAKSPDEVVPAKLYTVGVDIRREYRVHVFNNKVIDLVRKSRPLNETSVPENINMLIRNHTNGWVFCREFEFTLDNKEQIEQTAINAINAVGLDFGAVDIVTQKRTGVPFVLEINTAPGNENTTTHNYKNAIVDYINTLYV
jgi:glutathione synthase/RimK-type ligase-like ATP-grasp enzyme